VLRRCSVSPLAFLKWVLFSLTGLKRVVDTPQRVVERKDGKTGSRRALRARDGSRRGRRGRPVL